MSNIQQPLRLAWVITVNLMPLAWLLYGDWEVDSLIQLYWLENVVIGGYLILKILSISSNGFSFFSKNLFSALFFLVHFGGFCAIHGLLIFTFFDDSNIADQITDSLHTELGPFIILEMLYRVIMHTWSTLPTGFHWSVYALIISYGIEFIQNHIANNNYKITKANKLAKKPYRHIIIMHVAIIGCAIPISALNSPVILLIALVIGKTWLDVYLIRKEQKLVTNKELDQTTLSLPINNEN
ncbi:MAG: hypothetical protein K6L75_04920 [Cellvibrionaceae bacterium]